MNTTILTKLLTRYGAAAFVLSAALAVRADSVSYTNGVSGTFDFAPTAISLQQFDPSLGTLNSVSISIGASSLTSLTVSNSSPSTYGNPSSVWNDILILLGNSTFDQAVDALNPNSGNFGLPNAWLDVNSPHFSVAGLAAGSTRSFSGGDVPSSGAPVSVSGITSGTIFTDLQGTGFQDLDLSSASSVDSAIQGGATFSAEETVTGGMNVVVTYNFTAAPVPEPSSIGLLGLSIGGAAVMYLRRRMAA